MSKHTPGPWMILDNKARPLIHVESEETRSYIVSVPRKEPHISNAYLIAAAPDLLAGLRHAVKCQVREPELCGECCDAMLAVAKATGEAK